MSCKKWVLRLLFSINPMQLNRKEACPEDKLGTTPYRCLLVKDRDQHRVSLGSNVWGLSGSDCTFMHITPLRPNVNTTGTLFAMAKRLARSIAQVWNPKSALKWTDHSYLCKTIAARDTITWLRFLHASPRTPNAAPSYQLNGILLIAGSF